MSWRVVLLVTVLLVTGVALELTLLSRLPFPGATPALVTLIVVSLALSLGPGVGAVSGFAAGLVLDIAPPADGAIGVTALVLAVIGYAAGSVLDREERPVPATLLVVAVASGAAVLGEAIIASLLGDQRVLWDDVPSMVLATVLYSLVMAPFVVPAIGWLARRADPVPAL